MITSTLLVFVVFIPILILDITTPTSQIWGTTTLILVILEQVFIPTCTASGLLTEMEDSETEDSETDGTPLRVGILGAAGVMVSAIHGATLTGRYTATTPIIHGTLGLLSVHLATLIALIILTRTTLTPTFTHPEAKANRIKPDMFKTRIKARSKAVRSHLLLLTI